MSRPAPDKPTERTEYECGSGPQWCPAPERHPWSSTRRAKQFARVNQPDGIRWSWPDKPDFKVFWEAPALVLICGRSGNAEMALDCCRAGQNLMLAAHAMGLGTCWVGAHRASACAVRARQSVGSIVNR